MNIIMFALSIVIIIPLLGNINGAKIYKSTTAITTTATTTITRQYLNDADRQLLNEEFLRLIKNLELINRQENLLINKYLRTKSSVESQPLKKNHRQQRSLGNAVVESRK
jgi:hypothetical protein